MATLSSAALTLVDWAKRTRDGKTMHIVELLNQTNEILEDMLWRPSTDALSNQTSQRTTLPTVYWRSINGGVATSKSTTAQISDGLGMLEAWAEVDAKLAEVSGDVKAFRLSEAEAFIEAMNQEAAQTIFYGNSGVAGVTPSPTEFNGLTVRYNAISGATNSSHVLSGGAATGQTDCSSMWLVVWGKRTVHGLFPRDSKAGLSHEDLGKQTQETTAGVGGTRQRVYQDRFSWDMGLAVPDWRYAVRACNLDISNLIAKSSAADLPELMIKMIHRIPNLRGGKAAFYMNRTVRECLDIQLRDDVQSGGQLSYETVDGKPVAKFRGIPVRICDALVETESVVA